METKIIDYPIREKKRDTFSQATQKMIEHCSMDSNHIYNINSISNELGFHQRRFYDIINVLGTVGMVTKLDSFSIRWEGYGNIQKRIRELILKHRIYDKNSSLGDIIPGFSEISISCATELLLMSFFATTCQSIDIKKMALYMSRNSGRSKTLLCKLYQITQILDLVSIIRKTNNASEIVLADEYYFPNLPPDNDSPMSIAKLLSKPVFNFYPDKLYKNRYLEFQSYIYQYQIETEF